MGSAVRLALGAARSIRGFRKVGGAFRFPCTACFSLWLFEGAQYVSFRMRSAFQFGGQRISFRCMARFFSVHSALGSGSQRVGSAFHFSEFASGGGGGGGGGFKLKPHIDVRFK